MSLRVLRAAGRAGVPWKNGGGVTREVAVRPEGAGTGGFDWRVSFAEVGKAGAFSVFPGADRILTVVRGAGMELTVGGRRRVVDERFRPYGFPGGPATDCVLLGGPVVNFNVMYRGDRTAARVDVVQGTDPVQVDVPEGATVLVVALEHDTLVGDLGLGPYDAAVPGSRTVLRTEGHAAVVTFRPVRAKAGRRVSLGIRQGSC